MIKKLLLTAILALGGIAGNTVYAANSSTTPDTEMGPEGFPTAQYETPKIQGLYKFELNKRGSIRITRGQPLGSTVTHAQAHSLLVDYGKTYLQLKTPQQKAQHAYEALEKVAQAVDFSVTVWDPPHKEKFLRLSIFSQGIEEGYGVRLIRPGDMPEVYPLFMQLLTADQALI